MAANIIRIKIIADTGQMTAGMAKANAQISTLGATMSRVGRTMTAFAALFVARKLISGITESVKGFADFEKGIANIGILLGDEIGRLSEWNDLIGETSVRLGVATEDLLKAGFDIQSATNDMSLSLEIFKQASELAVAGGSNVADTVKGALTINEVYADSFRDISDMMDFMIVAQKKARATIGELSSSSSKFIGVAASLGITVEELFAVYAQATRGFGNAKDAATGMSAILNSLQKPSQKMIELSREQFGMSIQQAVKEKGLIEVFRKLNTVTMENIGTTLGRIRANRLFAIVRDDINTVEESAIELIDREGQKQKLLNFQLEQTKTQLNQTGKAFESMGRSIGLIIASTGVIKKFADIMISLAAAINLAATYMKDNKESIKSFFDTFGVGIKAVTELAIPFVNQINSAIEAIRLLQQLKGFVTDPGSMFTSKKKEEEGGEVEDPAVAANNTKIALLTEQELAFTEFIASQAALRAKLIEDSAKAEADASKIADDKKKKGIQETFKELEKSTKLMAQGTQESLSMLSDIFIFAGGEAEKYKNIVKGIQIAEAVMNTAVGITRALATYAWPYSLIVGGIVAAAGAVQIAKIASMHEGGIVPGVGSGDKVPAMLEPGELVIPKAQVQGGEGGFTNSPTIHVHMDGALIMDDPTVVQRLYREGLRDQIRNDIRTRRDVFYG